MVVSHILLVYTQAHESFESKEPILLFKYFRWQRVNCQLLKHYASDSSYSLHSNPMGPMRGGTNIGIVIPGKRFSFQILISNYVIPNQLKFG